MYGNAERVEGLDHVDRRDVPIQVAFAEIDEDVVGLGGGFAKLAVGGGLAEEEVVEFGVGQQSAQRLRGGS